MTRLIVEAQELETVAIDPNELTLLGRVPDAKSLAKYGSLLPGQPVHTQAVPAPSVSTNHAAAWVEGGELHLLDLDSRNGTWVRLPRSTVLRLPAEGDIHLRLASSVWTGGSEQHPELPRYTDRADFGAGIAHAVRAWLLRHDVPARVWTERQDGKPSRLPGISPLHLANGESLLIQPERTVDAAFHERMVQICRFLSVQNALFTAEEDTRSNGMILASPGIRRVHRRVVELGMQSLPALILLGPSGSGKERLAQSYHRSLGRNGPLIAINCATLSRDRIVADLFGAEAGAYTDAKRAMTGAVERADGGTLFLDELGELPLDVQPLLLRFLETGEYQRLGSTGYPRFSDAKVVAATNRDLRKMVREGSFREDLFFRLALEIVEVPPLEERFLDVESYLRGQLLGDTSAHDAMQPEAIELLRTYAWTGNFRELINLVRRLPRPSTPGSLDVHVVRKALEAGSLFLAPVVASSAAKTGSSPGGWLDWVQASAAQFQASIDGAAPATWGEMTSFIERFLKPWALAHLGGVAGATRLEDISVGQVAELVKADRGTVTKQLRRYFEAKRDG